jgi:glutaconate CoA-transferase subunit A
LPEVNQALRIFRDPIKGEQLLAVPAIEIDVCLLHAAHGDEYGNVRHNGTRYGDVAMSAASAETYVSVEQMISSQAIRANPLATSIDRADGIVRAPFGAHPFAAEGFYRPDVEHLRQYLAAATDWLKTGSRSALDEYLHCYIYGAEDNAVYLERIGIRRILSLHEF